ncbi:metal-dependent transcriptional regulator [Haloprofundus halophilus]|uniref:metal-dependent transcriptional regulator n=1 Tax=Haloprofundus halophilus TaxID=2283527 RepID=UPI000E43C84A|nr:metal-dependent transcriptional regulator [Haloprofundus halophilus]
MQPASAETGRQETFESSTAAVERGTGRYLVAIYWATTATDGRVRTGDVSCRLGVAPASVTEMFAKLTDAGFVRYERYDGVELTERGERLAQRLAWRQCVVETFFCRETGAPLESDVAYDLAYALPIAGIERLNARVRTPCPHACQSVAGGVDACHLAARFC